MRSDIKRVDLICYMWDSYWLDACRSYSLSDYDAGKVSTVARNTFLNPYEIGTGEVVAEWESVSAILKIELDQIEDVKEALEQFAMNKLKLDKWSATDEHGNITYKYVHRRGE